MLTAALDAPPIPASIANAETSNIIGNVTPKPASESEPISGIRPT